MRCSDIPLMVSPVNDSLPLIAARTVLPSGKSLSRMSLHLQGDLRLFRRFAHATTHRALIEARIEGQFHIVELVAHRHLPSFSERQDLLVAAQPLASCAQEPLHLRAHFIRCAPKAAVLVPVGVALHGSASNTVRFDAHRSTTEKRVLESG